MKQTDKHTQNRKHRWYFYPGMVLLVLAVLFGGFLGWLTAAEYRPEALEPALSGGKSDREAFSGDSLRILTFNTGYASLGEESDFVMDGGKGPGQADRATQNKNLEGIGGILREAQADVYMLQEIDRDSHRTFGENQLETFGHVLPDCGWQYAPNFLCKFVPFPFSKPFGSIDSGLATYSPWQMEAGERIALPNPFSWPLRTANLKRCMLRTRIPVGDRELVIFNFHLEAYDDGAGKAAQTEQVLQMIREEYDRGNYVIAGGDFNQIFPEVETELKPTSQWVPGYLEPLPQDMEGWQLICDDATPTCRLLNQPYAPDSELTQYYVIDGFIVSSNLEVESITTLDAGFHYSDHNPVLLEVTLK